MEALYSVLDDVQEPPGLPLGLSPQNGGLCRYSLRMERLLSRPGWVEGLWGAFGSPQNGGLCRLQSSYGTATFQAWLGRGPLGSFWELSKRRPL